MSATCEVLNEPADSKRKEGAGHPRPQRNTLNLANNDSGDKSHNSYRDLD